MWTILDVFRVRPGNAPLSRVLNGIFLGALFWGVFAAVGFGAMSAIEAHDAHMLLVGGSMGLMMGSPVGGIIGGIAGAVTRETFRGTLAWAVTSATLCIFICWPSDGTTPSFGVYLAACIALGGILGAGAYTVLANIGRPWDLDKSHDQDADSPPGSP